jgi:rhodanese-related sulfurtransferase
VAVHQPARLEREETPIMRARFRLPTLAIVILTVALAATGCSSQEAGSSNGTDATATMEPAPAAQGAGWLTVDVQTTYDALEANADAQLVDVREPAEWAETGVPQGATLIPLGDLESRAGAELAADRPVYVICRSGNRSQTGSDILVGLGFGEVYNVDGGVTAWLAAGLPMETYQP